MHSRSRLGFCRAGGRDTRNTAGLSVWRGSSVWPVLRFFQGRDKISRAVAAASERTIAKQAVELVRKPTVVLDVTGSRPSQALNVLHQALPQDATRHKRWIADARIAAVLGSCPKSHASFVSGLCCGTCRVEVVAFICKASEIGATSPRYSSAAARWTSRRQQMPLCVGRTRFAALARLPITWGSYAPLALRWTLTHHLAILLSFGEPRVPL